MLSSENMETSSVVLPTNITGNVSTTAPPTNGTGELDVISLCCYQANYINENVHHDYDQTFA